MSFSPIGDTVAVVNLAYSLYNRVIVVAREAPDQLEELSHELQIFKGVLFHVHDQISRDPDSAGNAAVQDVLVGCFRTLRALRDLTAKYENLAWSDRSVFFKRLKFASEQGAIEKFREKFKEQQRQLQFCLTVEGRNQLNKIAREVAGTAKGLTTVETNDHQGHDERCSCSYRSLVRAQTTATIDSATTLCNHRDIGLDTSPRNEHSGTSYFRTRKPSSSNTASKGTPRKFSQDVRSLSFSTVDIHEESLGDTGPNDVDTDNSGSRLLDQSTISSPIKAQQPLSLPSDRVKHNANPQLQHAFRQSFEDLDDDFNAESWLRLATWWVIKSRIIWALIDEAGLQRRKTDESQYQDGWERCISFEQVYTDLLKASWILEEIVLKEAKEEDLAYIHIRRIIKDLTSSLDRDIRRARKDVSDGFRFDDKTVLQQNSHLLERLEDEIEAKESVPIAIDDPSSAHRWFATHQDNAGERNERILFRTFVNAQLGDKTSRFKSSTAPYMLLLWTTAEQSDLLFSLCNQRGTVNLSRKMLAEDVEHCALADGRAPFVVKFPSQEAEIMFLSTQNVSDFLAQPRLFFAAIKGRDALDGELAIYQAPVSNYSEPRPPPHLEPSSPTKMSSSKTSSLGLRVYESTPDKCWKTTRRLVITSSPDSATPGCASHWLPLDHVRILVDRTQATVSWSDCGQLTKSKEINYQAYYSFVYRPEEPNRKIHLDFTNETEAQKFKDSLLLPTEMPPQIIPEMEIDFSFQSLRIYRLFDAEEPDRFAYHAIALIKKSPQGPHVTEVFYVYRELDWIIRTKNDIPNMVTFPYLRVPRYTSTIARLQFEPKSTDGTPKFCDVRQDFKSTDLELGCDHDLFRLMQGLTGWRLTYFRTVEKLTLIDTSPVIGNTRTTYKGVDIQLWEKASHEGRSRTQLAVRLDDSIQNPWITASLVDNNYTNKYLTIEFERLIVERGVGVDTKSMTARSADENAKPSPKMKWKIAITFRHGNSDSDKEEFLRFVSNDPESFVSKRGMKAVRTTSNHSQTGW